MSNSLMKSLTDEQIVFLNTLNKQGFLNADVGCIITYFGDNKKRKKKKSVKLKNERNNILLPFCGIINRDKCYAMKKNHGLYTQCKNKKNNDNDYCITCTEAAENSPTEKPPNGDIRERDGLKATNKLQGLVPYANVMSRLKINKIQAINQAAKYGWEIPEEEWIEVKKKRGRPKKQTVALSTFVADTSDEEEYPEPNYDVSEDDIIKHLISSCI